MIFVFKSATPSWPIKLQNVLKSSILRSVIWIILAFLTEFDTSGFNDLIILFLVLVCPIEVHTSQCQRHQKCLSAIEISVFFNRQYFINRWISDFDFWHVDRHEWKKQGSWQVFWKKNYHLGKWAILGPKIVHPHNSGSAVRIFLNFAQWKGPIGRWK